MRRPECLAESGLCRLRRLHDPLCRFLRSRFRIAIDDDDRTAFRNIRRRKSCGERNAGDATIAHQPAFRLTDKRVKRCRWLYQRALCRKRNEIVEAAHRLCLLRTGFYRGEKMLRRPRPCFCHIDMRIGAVCNQRIRFRNHALRHIRVKIKARSKGYIRPDKRADTAKDFPLPIIKMLRDHGAMKIEINSINRACRSQILKHHAHDALKGIFRDMSGGRGRTPDKRDKRVARRSIVDEARNRDIHACESGKKRLPPLQGRP